MRVCESPHWEVQINSRVHPPPLNEHMHKLADQITKNLLDKAADAIKRRVIVHSSPG